MTVIERIQDVFRYVFDDDNLIVKENTNPSDIEDWDSLANIQLVAELEREFGIKFLTSDFSKMTTVGGIIAVIDERSK